MLQIYRGGPKFKSGSQDPDLASLGIIYQPLAGTYYGQSMYQI